MDASLVAQAEQAARDAVIAYGTDVLAQVEGQAAGATVMLGRRLLQRIFGRRGPGEVPEVIAGLAADPESADRRVALRVEIGEALEADPVLAADVARMLGADRTHVLASGERSIATITNQGV